MTRALTGKEYAFLRGISVTARHKPGKLPVYHVQIPSLCRSSFPSSPESRKEFLKAVHSILRDKHRRQLLKTESLPSSQQYVPFGGKRLCALKGARPAMSRAGTVGIQTFTIPVTPTPL